MPLCLAFIENFFLRLSDDLPDHVNLWSGATLEISQMEVYNQEQTTFLV